jgi:hypothetical protein
MAVFQLFLGRFFTRRLDAFYACSVYLRLLKSTLIVRFAPSIPLSQNR